MIVEIHNYLSASYLLETAPSRWSAIVILDSNTTATGFLATQAVDYLLLRFDDIITPESGKHLADLATLQRAIDYAKGKDRLIVSCRAGQSRSAALAHAICFQYNGAKAASDLLNPKRHKPNRHVIETIAQLVDDPTYLDQFDAWGRRHAGNKIMDHIEELEAEFDALEAKGARNLIVTT